jgi:hypothetical protein
MRAMGICIVAAIMYALYCGVPPLTAAITFAVATFIVVLELVVALKCIHRAMVARPDVPKATAREIK